MNVPIIGTGGPAFRCVLDKIFVQEIPVEDQRIVTGVLDLERAAKFEKKPMTGRVLAVGDGCPMGGILMPMPYKPGQVVRCSEYGREYINLKTGENGITAFAPGERKTFLIRVADTHGEVI